MFYIKQLTMTGERATSSTVLFEPGLNIIHGPSNCGKSYIAECLDFMFGSKDTRIDKTLGYDTVRIIVSTDSGDVQMERKFDTKSINVVSSNPNIESGTYKIDKGKTCISFVWLKLMGIMDPVKIIGSGDMKERQLTFRTFYHMLLVKETPVFKEDSILLPTQATSVTAMKTALLYMMTGNNYLSGKKKEDKKIVEARRKAVKKYVTEQLEYIDKQKEALQAKASQNPAELQRKISDTLTEIDTAEGEISKAVARSQQLASEIFKINDQLAECANLHKKYQILKGQYAADVQRISFIAEGELHKDGIPEVTKCPFCNGDLPQKEEESCVDAARAELERLLPQIADLEDAEKAIVAEQHELTGQHEKLLQERKQIENIIRFDLRPRVAGLRENLGIYTTAVESAKEAAMLFDFESRFRAKLLNPDDAEESSLTFKPASKYNDTFRATFNEIITGLLQACHFEDFRNARFDVDKFDVVVNDKPKGTYGKGFRAFLNTILVIALHEYLAMHGKYKPGILIIDSPILSLKERIDEQATDSMKSSLFAYLLDHQENRQTIIIENDIPPMDYCKANMITFTKNSETGRYGFLKDVK